MTDDLGARVVKHNEGRASAYTAIRRPVTLAYFEEHETLRSALNREKQLKRWTRAKKEALVEGDLELLKAL